MKVLFAASEAYPLIKTGGLGDVIYSLPRALTSRGMDVKVILPGYREILKKVRCSRILGWMEIPGAGRSYHVRILETDYDGLGVPLLLADNTELFDRAGNPYQHPDGYDWPDNAERFTVFSRAVAKLAVDQLDTGWRADVVHSHDWQTGLVPGLLGLEESAPSSVFTIHNLAYSGLFTHEQFTRLQLPGHWWSADAAEFYGNFSMLKAGVVFANQVTTVSPTYAREILTPEFGYGLQGALTAVKYKLSGIINGIDDTTWNPKTDKYLAMNYAPGWKYMAGKRANKAALFKDLGVEPDDKLLEKPLLGFVGRLVEQKGVDLLMAAVPQVMEESDAAMVLVGTGQHYYEHGLEELARKHPGRIFVHIGYSEEIAHRVEAGADMFLMPSRFEPCGLNQLYSLRYGTPPIVHGVGGLADTVVDATQENLANNTATGFVFNKPEQQALLAAIMRALDLYNDEKSWRRLIRTAMAQDYGWDQSADAYQELYQSIA